MGRQPLPAIHDENHDIRFSDSLPRLLGHFMQDAIFSDGFETTRIDDEKRPLTHAAFTIVAVTREARQIRHKRIARACQAVEERGFTDVRPTNERNDGLHRTA
jgi:hypothetical protein